MNNRVHNIMTIITANGYPTAAIRYLELSRFIHEYKILPISNKYIHAHV